MEQKYFTKLQGPSECFDGRRADKQRRGPKFPGGALLFVVYQAVSENRILNEELTWQNIQKQTRTRNVNPGVHRAETHGENKNKSGCGLADGLISIIQLAQSKEMYDIAIETFGHLKDDNPSLDPNITARALASLILLCNYDPSNLQLTGNELIGTAVASGAKVDYYHDVHSETEASINLRKGTTLDAKKATSEKKSAYNLDLLHAKEIGDAINLNGTSVSGLALGLYVVTLNFLGAKEIPMSVNL